MTRPRVGSRFFSLLFPAFLVCGTSVAAGQASDSGTERVVINFRPVVGSRAFACGVAYDRLGPSPVTFSDFRLYVHDARLVRRDGSDVSVSLEQDGLWQYRNVALLDFENGEGACSNGTPDVRSFIAGTVPKGEYVGLRFTVGVPSDLNHLDVTRAPSPLTLTAMYWSWNAGYIFMRVEFTRAGSEAGFLHLGSMRCGSDRKSEPDSCALPNRPKVAFREFDPRVDSVEVDLEALLRPALTSSLEPQCMSEASSSCANMFAPLGLAQGSRSANPQVVFRAVRNSAARGGAAAKRAGAALDSRTGQLRPQQSAYHWELPAGFPEPKVPADNPMSDAKVELGRHLFYDRRLSANRTFSCANCHQQSRAFADALPHGVGSTDEVHPRGSMSLANVAYAPALTWSNPRMRRLEQQALAPLFGEHPVELGLAGKEAELMARLSDDERYLRWFADAFPTDTAQISLGNMTKAIAAFERTLISGNAAYDAYERGDSSAITASAKRGAKLFFGERTECAHCHGGITFTGSVDYVGKGFAEAEFHNTGLYNVDGKGAYPAASRGTIEITGAARDMGRFKAPSLRNIALTAPYMHDGSVESLEAVLDHYMSGGRTVTSGPNRGVGRTNPYKSGFIRPFRLTTSERTDLIAFLRSLTDSSFLTNPRFANPWADTSAAMRASGPRGR